MEVIVGKLAGFCPGVENTIKKAEEALKNKTPIYCLGEIVHNGQAIKSLEEKGMITVNCIDEIPENSTVIFRAHGEAKSVYDKAHTKNLEIIDLTCGKVKLIHEKVEKHSKESFIIILGKKTHPEVIGTKGFIEKNGYVIENEDDILDAYMEFENTDFNSVYIVVQTTMSSKYFDELSKEVEKNFVEVDCIIDKTICSATEKRQEEMLEMSKEINNMIIIGGKNSSNTKELARIAEKNCEKIYLVETVDELKDIDFSDMKKIGIMAGASTPKESIDEVKSFILKLT